MDRGIQHIGRLLSCACGFAGELASKAKELRTTEAERNRLRSSVQDLEREADRLTQKLHAKPMVLHHFPAEEGNTEAIVLL